MLFVAICQKQHLRDTIVQPIKERRHTVGYRVQYQIKSCFKVFGRALLYLCSLNLWKLSISNVAKNTGCQCCLCRGSCAVLSTLHAKFCHELYSNRKFISLQYLHKSSSCYSAKQLEFPFISLAP